MAVSKEEVKKDIDEFISRMDEPDSEKTMQKQYDNGNFVVNVEGYDVILSFLVKNLGIFSGLRGNVKDFDSLWEQSEQMEAKYSDMTVDDYALSFQRQMGQRIQPCDIDKPIDLTYRKKTTPVIRFSLTDRQTLPLVAKLFERVYATPLDYFIDKFIRPSVEQGGMVKLTKDGLLMLTNAEDKNDKFIFDLSERLGQFIVYLMRSITKD